MPEVTVGNHATAFVPAKIATTEYQQQQSHCCYLLFPRFLSLPLLNFFVHSPPVNYSPRNYHPSPYSSLSSSSSALASSPYISPKFLGLIYLIGNSGFTHQSFRQTDRQTDSALFLLLCSCHHLSYPWVSSARRRRCTGRRRRSTSAPAAPSTTSAPTSKVPFFTRNSAILASVLGAEFQLKLNVFWLDHCRSSQLLEWPGCW